MTARQRRRNIATRKPSRRLNHEALEKRELLAADISGASDAPQLISVAANSGEQFDLDDNNLLSVAPSELTFRFGGDQQLDPSTLDAIQFVGAGGDGSFDDGNERVITPGFLGFQDEEGTRIVVARFAESLADDQYRIQIAGYDDTGAGIVGLRNVDGDLFQPPEVTDAERPTQRIRFEVEVGPRVVAVVPQPIQGTGASRTQLRDQVYVYFNDDPLSNPAAGPISSTSSSLPVVNRDYYKLIFTGDTVENTDDGAPFLPTTVSYDPALNRAVLTFESDLAELAPAASQNGAATFRLRIGSGDPLPSPPTVVAADSDTGETFNQAMPLGVSFGSGSQSVVVTDGVIRSTNDVIPQWPGASDAVGSRENRRDEQLVGRPDTNTGIDLYEYNFASLYGLDPQGNNLDNAITDAQKQRAREVLSLYSERLGVQFMETENRGLQIVTGDLRAIVQSADTGAGADTPYSLYRVNERDPSRGVLVLDAAENWYDGYGLSPDSRPAWFVEAVRGIGSLLGIGHLFELPPGVGAGGSSPDEPNSTVFSDFFPDLPLEPDFLSQSDVTLGQALHRPESDDVDFYSFHASETGRLTAETFAERLDDSSLLDTHLRLYRVVAPGQYELVATNDDMFSEDSFVGVDVAAGDYIIGVSSTGNDGYNGEVAGSALGGRSEGRYELRVTFEADTGSTITDTAGTALDGDADGNAGGDFNFWFRTARDTATPAADEPRTIYVDKFGNDAANGTLDSPLRTVGAAFSRARPDDIVRLLPNGGSDGVIATQSDNRAYEIGRGGANNTILADGAEFEVPRGVTVMIDAGAILKLQRAKISVGSESADEDRSLAALQILGAPILTETVSGGGSRTSSGQVFFSSFDDTSLGLNNNPLPATPQAGNWAGIEFRNDFDYSQGRPVWETEGIFLDYASHANIQYGGGSITPNQPIVTPIQMAESRPTLIYNTIRNSADAAISADPDSFLETNFHAPIFQRVTPFTSDYQRVGPEFSGNRLVDNSINGLFVRVNTPAAGQLEPMTVSGRFDDQDIVHVLSQVLVLQGQPGGPLLLQQRPDMLSVTFNDAQGTLTPGQAYDYRLTYVTSEGSESPASLSTAMKVAPASGGIRLNNLPSAPEQFSGRRLYRLDPATGSYVFVTQLDRGSAAYVDNGDTRGGVLPDGGIATETLLPRYDARLSVDPGLVVKMQNARIEAGFGSDFYAEGRDGEEVIFTSRLDDSYGAGGTFDTNNDGNAGTAEPGDWGGLVFRQDSTASLDHVELAHAGGTTTIEGGFTEFNPIEILQADVRIAHTTLRENASGFVAPSVRGGIGFNAPATIFVRGSQPIIVDNTIVDNEGAAISVNPNALDFHDVLDHGRSTGTVQIIGSDQDNQGPLISGNRLSGNSLNGMSIRSEILTTESVWDDTDIVHVVAGEVHSMTHHFRSGLRLRSDANRSLVVKFDEGATLVGSGRPLDIEDRVGGTLQVLGHGGFPVILTSLHDDTVGAGFTPDGVAQTDTDNANVAPQPGDWAGLQLLSYVNDRNVAYVLENERAISAATSANATADDAQVIGDLAAREYAGDENERLGFNVRGTLADPTDADVYRFTATGGTQVFVDIDDTTFGLDTVVELIDVNDNVLASSDNSFAETSDPSQLISNLPAGSVQPLWRLGEGATESPNALDAGMRVVLHGSSNTENTYYVRVRNAAGETSGQYQLAIRLREADEIAGATVQLADIRYATDAITVSSAPLHSPLAGELTESVSYTGAGVAFENNNNNLSFSTGNVDPLGNLMTSDRGSLVVSGEIGNVDPSVVGEGRFNDLDVYQVDLAAQQLAPDVFDSENRFVTTTFDIDYADGLGRPNTSIAVYNQAGELILHSRDSNIADDVGRPTKGSDAENLEGGSFGRLDAHIGPVELPEGSYYVVVSSAIAVPNALNQFFQENPTNSNVRLMPVNSIRRIADDGLDDYVVSSGADLSEPLQQLNYTADRPIIEPIFDQDSIVPYTLDDMRLFVSLDGGISGNNRSTLTSFNPFTGTLERLIGQFGPAHGDIAIRDDGELYTYSTEQPNGSQEPGNAGNYLNISSVDAGVTNQGDDSLVFRRNNENADGTEVDSYDNSDDAVLDIQAIAFPLNDSGFGSRSTDGGVNNTSAVNEGERFFAVGSRTLNGRSTVPSDLTENLLYQMQTSTGLATHRGALGDDRDFGDGPYRAGFGPAGSRVEQGVIDTGNIYNTGGDGGDITGLTYDPDDSSRLFAATDEGGLHAFAPDVTVPAPDSSAADGYNRVIPTTYYGQVPVDPNHAAAGASAVKLTSITFGPRNIEGQAFRDVIFGTTEDGWLYAFQIENDAIVPAHVFYDGKAALPLVSELEIQATNPVGLAFSTLENSPWHQTGDRDEDAGHGMFPTYDQSRQRTTLEGGSSLYYGFEITGDQADNTIERPDGDDLGTLAPGGSHGTVVSRPFDLREYNAADKPTLYFTYFMDVEADDDYLPGSRMQNDSFRVFGAGDDGQWKLLGTNNDFRELAGSDEYDYFNDTEIPVQELFDDTGWRQARIDISPLAGSENVRIRFDFSTAGSMRTQFGSIELVGVPGDELTDGSTFIAFGSNGLSTTFENIVGKNVVVPSGSALEFGDQFQVTGPEGVFTVRFVDNAAAVSRAGDVVFSPTDSAQQVAQAVIAVLPPSLRPYADGGGRISLLAATEVRVLGDTPAGQSNPVQVETTASRLIVPSGDELFAGERIQLRRADGTVTTLTYTDQGDASTSAPDEIYFSEFDTAKDLAERILAKIPTEYGGFISKDGVITFAKPVLVTLTASPSENQIDENVSVEENRFSIDLPDDSADLQADEELIFTTAAGQTFTIRFIESAAAGGPGTVHFEDGTPRWLVAERLYDALAYQLSAILERDDFATPADEADDVSVVASSVTTSATDSAIAVTAVTRSDEVVQLQIADGEALRDGEQIEIERFSASTRLTFARRGSPTAADGTNRIFFDDGDTAADLYDQILQALPVGLQAYLDPSGNGINVAADGTSAEIISLPTFTTTDTVQLNESAVPVTVPDGEMIRDGETIRIRAENNTTETFTFVLEDGTPPGPSEPGPNEIVYEQTDTAEQIAAKLLAALPNSWQAFQQGPRELVLLNATAVQTEPGSAIVGFQTETFGAIPILVDSTMTSSEVAEQLQVALAEGLGRSTTVAGENFATPDQYKLTAKDRIRIFNTTITDAGDYGLHQPGFIDTAMPGDQFGQGRSSGFNSTNQISTAGAQNNVVEGMYIDDIIIGFAERGEMVLNAGDDQGFTLNPETLPDTHSQSVQPERQNESLVGGYSLEIRTSDHFGVPEDYDPINLVLNETVGLGRSFDTNDRLADKAVTLFAPAGQDLRDGDQFVLYDGTDQLTFEFDSILQPGVSGGTVAVAFDPSGANPRFVAESIRRAVNSAQAQEVLEIVASTGDSRGGGLSTSGRVELFGSTVIVNPTGGRFIELDLVEEETYQGRATSRLIPVVDHENQTVEYVLNRDRLANAAVSGYVNGDTDTLVATGKIGDAVHTYEATGDAARLLYDNPVNDWDIVRIHLQAGQTVDMDVDTKGFARGAEILDLPVITVYSSTVDLLDQSSLTTPTSAAGEAEAGAFLSFTAPASGYYDIMVTGAAPFTDNFFGEPDIGEYQLTVRPGAGANSDLPDRDVVMVDYHAGIGDVNRVKDQGQIIISSNFISDSANYGVMATAGSRGQAWASDGNTIGPDETPRPGSARLLRNQNTDRLIPGTVISNNVVVDSGTGAILFSGGSSDDGQAPAPVPIGRIVNNTLVGTGSGSGVTVSSSASPTILNNVISQFEVGFDVDASSQAAGTVVGGNVFHENDTDSTMPIASSSLVLDGNEIFQDQARGDYIPAAGSAVIDSSFSSLPDRSEFFNTVKQPVGISPSPIIAPEFDAYGQPRVDDPLVTTPGGVGANVFIDRGAIDRADDDPLVAMLTSPVDVIGTSTGGDQDPTESFVRLASGTVEFFEIQLLDTAGTGPDIDTITEESVLLTENGRRLRPGVDYVFGYSDNSRTIRLTPLAGLWRPDGVYEITLNNQPRIAYEARRGDQIADGDQVIITDADGAQSVFEFESGNSVIVPQTTLLTINETNAGFEDRDTFTIVSPVVNPGDIPSQLTFEINRTGSTAGANIAINLADAGTISQVREAFWTALSQPIGGATVAEFLNLVPRKVGLDSIQLGTLEGHSITGDVDGLTVSGQTGGVADGETFTYGAGNESVTFEFTSDPSYDPANTPITFSRSQTPDEIAESIVEVIRDTDLGLASAQAIGNGGVLLGGEASDTISLDDSSLQLRGLAGTSGSLSLTVPETATGATLAESTFEVDVDGTTVTFQYTLDPTQTSANTLILLGDTDGPAAIASQTAAVIGAAFPEALSPTAQGPTITLGEQAAAPPVGVDRSVTTVDQGNSGLIVDGVSGGAIPVSFLPTDQFGPSAASATLQAAIADSPLSVQTFSPGGGTLLISGAASVRGIVDGAAVDQLGVAVPAVSDLAGTPVRETRVNNETRFTIIMPKVTFDFGDAPVSYATLLANNGARHTVGGERTPRLGNFLDTETTGQPSPASDDAPLPVTVTETGDVFVVHDTDATAIRITVSQTAPAGGETLRLDLDGSVTTFELTDVTSNPTTGNVPITFNASDSAAEIAERLAVAIRARLADVGDGVLLTPDASDPASFQIQAVDDEDGISTGVFRAGGVDYNVFTVAGTDPNNVSPDAILGFINPLDPNGANVSVDVTGSGLVDAWIDFDNNGVFSEDEQVLQNTPVVNGLNTLNIVAPGDATAGDRWARFRISDSGNLNPSGVAVGGEVEDYQMSVLPLAAPKPTDDSYTTGEDEPLIVTSVAPPETLLANDQDLQDQILPPRFFPVDLPSNGQLIVTDEFAGTFQYIPDADFNGIDTFTYRLSTQQNAGSASSDADSLATVAITVAQANDPPEFDIETDVEVLEDQGNGQPVTITGLISNATPGPDAATDESGSQSVSYSIDVANSAVPAGLLQDEAQILANGDFVFTPAADAFGEAIYVITVSDDDPTDPRTVTNTVTLNIRPVNDAPQMDDSRLGESDTKGTDDAYVVADGDDASVPDGQESDLGRDTGTVIYTMAEDQGPFYIPLAQNFGTVGFSRIGLLDVLNVGPANETLNLPGGPQNLVVDSVPTSTAAGGSLAAVRDANGVLTGYNYTPPVDFNSAGGGTDSFTYAVLDNNPGDGETYSLSTGGLVEDRLVTSNTVEIIINPVNDKPQFDLTETSVATAEDSDLRTVDDLATNIFAGPPLTAFDEADAMSGQDVSFTVTSLTFPQEQAAQFFEIFPSISPEGALTYQPAEDVFGQFVFEIVLTDDGPDNSLRGDRVSSDPATLTINVRPINDPPSQIDPDQPLTMSLDEDTSIEIPVRGSGAQRGLLDLFRVGPENEAADNAAVVGGNQTLQLATPLPTSTAEGGTLTPRLSDSGEVEALIYRPRTNFSGSDSFIFGVLDDGVSVDSSGDVIADARRAFATVSFDVTPVNDSPQFSGAQNHVSNEDAGTVTVTHWATQVQPGPAGADDENLGSDTSGAQSQSFTIALVDPSKASLFEELPTATIVGSTATLSYKAATDQNGIANFTVTLQDDGGTERDGDDTSTTKTFSVRVDAVNDPPQFTPGDAITVNEDSGVFSGTWATEIAPGPATAADEADQGVSFRVVTPTESADLFQSEPRIDADGVLRFTPAENANGTASIEVSAVDSEGAQAASVTLRIVVNEANDPPAGEVDDLSTNEDSVLEITTAMLTGNDQDPDLQTNPNETLSIDLAASSFSAIGAPITFDAASGIVIYDPTDTMAFQELAPGESLVDVFTYSVVDASGARGNPTTVSIEVAGINDAPRLQPDSPTLNPSGSTTIAVLANDQDVDGTIRSSTLQVTQQPAFGTLTVTGQGIVSYTPFTDFAGEDEFRYTVEDNLGLRSAEATVTVSANAAPQAEDDNAVTFFGESLDIAVTTNDTDPDSPPGEGLDPSSLAIAQPPQRGQAVPMANGSIRYIPDSDFIGTDTFSYTVADAEGRVSNVATVQVDVRASRLRNPMLHTDVNNDGSATAIDALLIINRLNRAGNVPEVEVTPEDSGPPYYDVTGDRQISALDALQVINALNRQGIGGSGEGELAAVSASVSHQQDAASYYMEPTISAIQPIDEKFVDDTPMESVSADVVDLLASDRQEKGEENDATTSAIDAVIATLV